MADINVFLCEISYSCLRSSRHKPFFGIKIKEKTNLHVRFERDGLIGVGHHGDEHVEEDDHVTAGVDPEH